MVEGAAPIPLFFGHHELTIDEKGRVSIPSVWRRVIPITSDDRQRLIVKRGGAAGGGGGGSKNAELVPLDTYLKTSAMVPYSIESSPEEEAKQRRVFSHVWDLEIDKAGRVVLPDKVRQLFGLNGEVTLAGRGHHMEFWNREAWNAFQIEEMGR